MTNSNSLILVDSTKLKQLKFYCSLNLIFLKSNLSLTGS